MEAEEVIAQFKVTGALLEGHFIYASGRHGNRFLQASRVLQHPVTTERLCKALADRVRKLSIDLVVGPATGGIILSYETARHVGTRAAFTEKEPDGSMALKRGFRLDPGTRVYIVEDIITTGGSVQKTIDHLVARGAEIVAVGSLIDRSCGAASFGVPFYPLAEITLDNWAADELPDWLAEIPVSEPDDLIV